MSDQELQKIKSDPYNYICKWMEDRLPYTGGKAYKIVALMPVSLILPNFNYMGDSIRTNINALIMAPPSAGKSTIADSFAKITFAPLQTSSITPRKLEGEIKSRTTFSLVVEDFSRMIRSPETLKIIENVLGEEQKVNRMTMRSSVDKKVNGVGLFMGTSQDLSTYITGGFIFRAVPVIISHTADQHSLIGKKIMENIGRDSDFALRQETIKDYYMELLQIQQGEHDKVKPVEKCYMDPEFNKRAFDVWDQVTKSINSRLKVQLNWFRELQEFARFLFTHAFMNVWNRKVEKGVIYPNNEDFDIAIRLMEETLQVKYDIVSMNLFSRNIADLQELENVLSSPRLSEQRRDILMNLMKGKIKAK